MTELELALFIWATAATGLWLVERFVRLSVGGARIAETPDEDPRDIPEGGYKTVPTTNNPDRGPVESDEDSCE